MTYWDWAVQAHGREGVDALLIDLQDRHGQCVAYLLNPEHRAHYYSVQLEPDAERNALSALQSVPVSRLIGSGALTNSWR